MVVAEASPDGSARGDHAGPVSACQAVVRFQADAGLVAGGIVGAKIWEMLADRSVHGV